MRSAILAASLSLAAGSSLIGADPAGETLGIVRERPTEGRYVETDRGFMVPYTVELPLKVGDEAATFTMVPIPGGTFAIGSPDDEAGRAAVEGPRVAVTVAPYWIADKEVSWAEYHAFMSMTDLFVRFAIAEVRPLDEAHAADVISAPSNLYEPSFTYSNGDEPDLPAVSMSQFAARQYTKWLSLLTGEFYRLPSEAEWEHAARAGTDSTWFFGDDASRLGDYAWFDENSAEKTHPIGGKRPNPWGLYDVYGNVAEWTLDAYTENGYAQLADRDPDAGPVVQWPTSRYPRALRGGTYATAAAGVRSASRLASAEIWRKEDPNIPRSPWWLTSKESLGVGMRIVRPLTRPADRETIAKCWEIDDDDLRDEVEQRIDYEGKGAYGWVDDKLPEAKAKVEASR